MRIAIVLLYEFLLCCPFKLHLPKLCFLKIVMTHLADNEPAELTSGGHKDFGKPTEAE